MDHAVCNTNAKLSEETELARAVATFVRILQCWSIVLQRVTGGWKGNSLFCFSLATLIEYELL